MSSFYVRRTDRIHPLRPVKAHAELIDGDATTVVRPYLAERERADQAAELAEAAAYDMLSPELVEAVAYTVAAAELRAMFEPRHGRPPTP